MKTRRDEIELAIDGRAATTAASSSTTNAWHIK